MSNLRERINFALIGSLIDIVNESVPNFRRSSPLWLEQYVDDNLELQIVEAHHPALFEDGTIYLEAASLNEATWNTDLYRNDWVKGENITIQADEAEIPTRRFYGDRLIFAGDPTQDPNKQTMYRDISLAPHTEYTLTVIARLWGGGFSTADRITVSGDVTSARTSHGAEPSSAPVSSSISLAQLNNFPSKYRLLQTSFTTGGTEQIAELQYAELEITQINNNLITLQVISENNFSLEEGELKLVRLLAEDNKFLKISDNTSKSESDTSFIVEIEDFSAGTIPNLGDFVTLHDTDLVPVRIEIYAQSATVFDWGGFKLEPQPFRTSFNFQYEQSLSTSASELVYSQSPLQNKTSFAILAEIKFWRGKAIIFSTDNLKVWLEDQKLYLDLEGTIISHPNIPQKFTLLIQFINYRSLFQVYVDRQLVLVHNTSFTPAAKSNLDLSQLFGAIAICRLIFFADFLDDGEIDVLGFAAKEVKEAFDDVSLIPPSAINKGSTYLYLPAIELPAASSPSAEAFILAVKNVTKTIQVENVDNFNLNDRVYIVRYYNDEATIVIDTNIVNIDESNKLLSLSSVRNVRAEDYLIKGVISNPGQASVRFPFLAIDSQTIKNIFPTTNELELNSTTAFVLGRTFVYREDYRDVAEVQVLAIDQANKRIQVDSIESIAIGHVVAQPEYETLISPDNYLAELQSPINRVLIKAKYTNGILLENNNSFPVRVSPQIKVSL